MIRNLPLIVLLSSASPFYCQGQEAFEGEAKEVYQVIINLFDGMREGDSAKVHQTFHPDVKMLTTFYNKEGKTELHEGSLQKFLDAVGTPHDEVWDEKIWDTQIQIDGPLAQAWTNYDFYLGDKFSHCGVDAFQFIKTDAGWKIIQLADTRKRSGCPKAEDLILEKIKAFSGYVVAGDAEALGRAYTQDASIFPGGSDILKGRAAIEKYWTPREDRKIVYHKVSPEEIRILHDEAYDYGYYEGRTQKADGTEVSWKGKYVIIWKLEEGEWKIFLDIWNRVTE